jgi:putative heme transporter
VLLPFVLAMFLAYVIAPAVTVLSRGIGGRKLPRWGAVLVLYAAVLGGLYGAGTIFVPQVYRELARLAKDGTEWLNRLDDDHIAEYAGQLGDWLKQYNLPVEIVTPEGQANVLEGELPQDVDAIAGVPVVAIEPTLRTPPAAVRHGQNVLTIDLVEVAQGVLRDVTSSLRTEASRIVKQVQFIVGGVLRILLTTFLVLMLTAFLAADSDRIKRFTFSILPIADRSRFEELLARIDNGLSGVVRGQLTICLINGGLTLLGLLLLKVKFAFLLATVAAVFSLVPIFGSITSTIPIVLVASSSGFSTALLSLLWIVGIHALEANFLNPKIMGDAAKMHPALVVLALVVGEHFYGFLGALLAVPLASIVVTIFKSIRSRAMALDAEIEIQESTAPVEASPDGPHRRPRRLREAD